MSPPPNSMGVPAEGSRRCCGPSISPYSLRAMIWTFFIARWIALLHSIEADSWEIFLSMLSFKIRFFKKNLASFDVLLTVTFPAPSFHIKHTSTHKPAIQVYSLELY